VELPYVTAGIAYSQQFVRAAARWINQLTISLFFHNSYVDTVLASWTLTESSEVRILFGQTSIEKQSWLKACRSERRYALGSGMTQQCRRVRLGWW
jgi:hypothetical protein